MEMQLNFRIVCDVSNRLYQKWNKKIVFVKFNLPFSSNFLWGYGIWMSTAAYDYEAAGY